MGRPGVHLVSCMPPGYVPWRWLGLSITRRATRVGPPTISCVETSLDSVQLVRLLASRERRRVVAALTLADETLSPRALAQASGLTVREVVDALDRLRTAGLVVEFAGAYELVEAVFEVAARADVGPRAPSQHADQPSEVARVLDTAFRDGKLVQWPAKRSKRLVVLDHLSQHFEIGQRYDEREVNAILKVFNEDVATTRRYLVDEQFLDRSDGRYWRCGGSV